VHTPQPRLLARARQGLGSLAGHPPPRPLPGQPPETAGRRPADTLRHRRHRRIRAGARTLPVRDDVTGWQEVEGWHEIEGWPQPRRHLTILRALLRRARRVIALDADLDESPKGSAFGERVAAGVPRTWASKTIERRDDGACCIRRTKQIAAALCVNGKSDDRRSRGPPGTPHRKSSRSASAR
jgi:hypothetical protein